jgi:hypothetical protein
VGPLLLPFAGGLASRVSWRVFVRAVIADDGLHRAYGERGAFLTADGERDGAQNHAILPTIETASIRAFKGRAEASGFAANARRPCVMAMSPQAFTLTGFERVAGVEYAQSWLVADCVRSQSR